MSEQHPPTLEEADNDNDDLQRTQTIIVDPGQQPLRIDKFLIDRLPNISRSRVQSAIQEGLIQVDAREIKSNFKVKPGHIITIVYPSSRHTGQGLVRENIPLDIIYEDEDLLIVQKPSGMVVHPGIGNRSGTLVNALAYHFGELPVMEGNDRDRIGLVHRIDKNTSGLLVVAKSDDALTHLAGQFYRHTIERTYWALVWGQPEPPDGTIDMPIARHPRFREIYTTFDKDEGVGRHAITHYKMIEPLYYVSLMECRLETGRTHQIRVHMKHIGHPLFNDDRYGGDRILKGTVFSKYKSFVENTFTVLPRQGLHARSLGFEHPRTGEHMYFEAPLPQDMQTALERWRRYVHSRQPGQ